MPHRKRQINVLTDTDIIIIKTGRMGVIAMPTQNLITNPVTIDLIHGETPLRQADDGFGGLYDVYNIEQVHTINESGKDYHLIVNSGATAVYQDQIHSGREVLVILPVEDRFEASQIGYSLSAIR